MAYLTYFGTIGRFLTGRKTCQWETTQSNGVKVHGTIPNLGLYAENKTRRVIADSFKSEAK